MLSANGEHTRLAANAGTARQFALLFEPRLYPTIIRQATNEHLSAIVNTRDNLSAVIPNEAITAIAADNISGAAVILGRAGTAFSQLYEAASQRGAVDFEAAQQTVLETCIALALAQPDMTPLLRLASAVLRSARMASDALGSLKCAQQAALNFIANASRAARDAASRSAALIQDGARVLTHSRGSTVLAAFVEAKNAEKHVSVVLTESRPMLEGRAMAAALAGQRIPVTLIADAAASLALDSVDLVMLGADKVTPVNLVNKIGTRMIALAARERGLSLFAVCDSSKFIREDYYQPAVPRSRSADELWADAPRGVSVANCYFEPTPLDVFTGIVTEDGVLSVVETARRAEKSSIDDYLARALKIKLDAIK
jgi:translation initiation factor 2B subunit (eIF-2B alpha/beta/delta family)